MVLAHQRLSEHGPYRWRHADHDAAAGQHAHGAQFVSGPDRAFDHRPGVLFEQLAGVGENDAAAVAVVELGAEFVLERLDQAAEHRLADRQAHGSTRKCAGLRDGEEVFQLT